MPPTSIGAPARARSVRSGIGVLGTAAALLVLLTGYLSVTPASAATSHAQPAGCTIRGTDGDDSLRGTPGDDVICAGAGDDVVHGRGGRDVIYGGPGDDVLVGGPGKDLIMGGPGEDEIAQGRPAQTYTVRLSAQWETPYTGDLYFNPKACGEWDGRPWHGDPTHPGTVTFTVRDTGDRDCRWIQAFITLDEPYSGGAPQTSRFAFMVTVDFRAGRTPWASVRCGGPPEHPTCSEDHGGARNGVFDLNVIVY